MDCLRRIYKINLKLYYSISFNKEKKRNQKITTCNPLDLGPLELGPWPMMHKQKKPSLPARTLTHARQSRSSCERDWEPKSKAKRTDNIIRHHVLLISPSFGWRPYLTIGRWGRAASPVSCQRQIPPGPVTKVCTRGLHLSVCSVVYEFSLFFCHGEPTVAVPDFTLIGLRST